MRLILALLLLASPAIAQTPALEPASAARTGLRPAIRPAQTPAPVRPPLRDPGSDLTLSSPNIARRPLIATPRYGRETDDTIAQCRRECAGPYYACRSDGPATGCSTRWMQCQNACRTAATPR